MNELNRQGMIVLLSGRGSNYQALHQAQEEGRLGGRILGVLSDQPNAPGLARARENQTPAECIDRSRYAERSDFESSLTQAIAQSGAYWIVLAGFMRVLSAEFTNHHAGRIINIHPSLLPRHRGLNTHQRVIDAGDPEHGASVH
ncbi:MAG: formyltransferase family protein, partial [Wenzhouxiangella sp.]|nr:formyltransferase family protein [Wenzhouxiangella sp.]